MQAVIPENDIPEENPYAPFLRETFEEFQNWMQKDESRVSLWRALPLAFAQVSRTNSL
jgi:hypothetical protein